jgi:hypothetical protein
LERIIDFHQESAEQIESGLIQFHKSRVDCSCREWGIFYNQLKTDLIALHSTQVAKIFEILNRRPLVRGASCQVPLHPCAGARDPAGDAPDCREK